MKIGGPNTAKGGVVLYDGPSVIDGTPVIVIATFGSDNMKTGPLIQTWILVRDLYPLDAVKQGVDEAICGYCPHRGINGRRRSCYVNLLFGPRQVWQGWQNGIYRPWDAEKDAHLFRGQLLRVGAYGDPVAVPHSVWEPVLAEAYQATSYTHLWRLICAEPFKSWTMASVDSVTERDEARERGWRTYRVDRGEGLQPGEIWCPATEPGGNRVQCSGCMACDGHVRGSRRVDIVSPAHGAGMRHFLAWSVKREEMRKGIWQTSLFGKED